MFTEERTHWLYQHYRWLDKALPTRTDGSRPQLILPTPEFYPMRNTGDHSFAVEVFEATRGFMGLAEWPCVLTPQSEEEREAEEKIGRSGGLFGESKSSGAAGTFSAGQEVAISYSPALLRNPAALVATMAHELCHYLMAAVEEEPPCGWAEHEPLTDLAAVREGFGVFLCNAAFGFSQWTDHQYSGWRWNKQGYLDDSELAFSLGVFAIREKADPDLIVRLLKQNPGEVFWDSLDYIEDLERQARD
jgi:hypothetical protein